MQLVQDMMEGYMSRYSVTMRLFFFVPPILKPSKVLWRLSSETVIQKLPGQYSTIHFHVCCFNLVKAQSPLIFRDEAKDDRPGSLLYWHFPCVAGVLLLAITLPPPSTTLMSFGPRKCSLSISSHNCVTDSAAKPTQTVDADWKWNISLKNIKFNIAFS